MLLRRLQLLASVRIAVTMADRTPNSEIATAAGCRIRLIEGSHIDAYDLGIE